MPRVVPSAVASVAAVVLIVFVVGALLVLVALVVVRAADDDCLVRVVLDDVPIGGLLYLDREHILVPAILLQVVCNLSWRALIRLEPPDELFIRVLLVAY